MKSEENERARKSVKRERKIHDVQHERDRCGEVLTVGEFKSAKTRETQTRAKAQSLRRGFPRSGLAAKTSCPFFFFCFFDGAL